MNEDLTDSEQHAGRLSRLRDRASMRGCLLYGFGGIIAAVAIFILLIEFVGDDAASTPQQEFIAGPAEEFALADVNAFDLEHILLVRYANGDFRAFYDRSSKQQEIPGEDCIVTYDETATPGTLEQIEGMRGAFVEVCEGARSVWRVDGAYSFGSNYGNLDEFQTRIDDAGNIVVITQTRTCTRSAGVPGIPPFIEQQCEGAD
jgi:hypothetical protein